MHYFSVSFTHKNTTIDVRERLALSDDLKQSELIKLVLAHENISECVILSTCNRTEIMCFVDEFIGISDYIIKCLCLVCKIDELLIKNSPDIYEDSGFIHHIFSVASSLDSLVIGETQIVGQLKTALSKSPYSKNLAIAINYAFKCAAEVRNKTQISKNSVSVSSVAVAKAKELMDLKQKRILLIGSGQMIELAAKQLLKHTSGNICIISRTKANALKLANELGLECKDYADLANLINENDVIFSATSSSTPIITQDLLKTSEGKKYFFDIAIPRDVELKNRENIELYSVDSLNEIVQKNMVFKDSQAKLAYSIVSKMVKEFYKELNKIKVYPIIKAMRLSAVSTIEKELKIAIKKGYLKNSNEDEALRFAKQVIKSYLHNPTIRLKEIEEFDIDILKYIFDVKEEDEIY